MNQITKFALGVGVLLSAYSVSGFSTTLTFAYNAAPAGTVTESGTTITGITGVPFTSLIASGTPCASGCAITSGTLSLNGSTLTLTGDIATLGIHSPATLFTISLYSALTNSGGTNPLNVSLTGAGSISDSPTLLSDLGLTGQIAGGLQGYLIGQSSGANTFTTDSNGVTETVSPVPEPASWFLAMAGLTGIVVFSRMTFLRISRLT